MKLNTIIGVSLGVLALASCNDKMDYKEYNVYDKDYVSSSMGYVGNLMTDIYNYADYDFGQDSKGAILGSATDESEFATPGNPIQDLYDGAWSPANAHSTTWSNMYSGIADCNIVLSEFQGLKFALDSLNSDYAQQMYRYNNYKWESRFWRSYFYFNLVRQYGGVPLVTESPVGGNSKDINVMPRVSSDSIYKFIMDECNVVKDSIIEDYSKLGNMALPASAAETGRADKLAVLALRARAALYWASPLFNTTNDKSRYYIAAKYTKELLDACDARGKKLAADYSSLWGTDNWKNEAVTCEILFGRRIYGTGTAGASAVFEGYNYPVGIEGGSGGNCPTQNLVNAYEMQSTGLGIDQPGSGYNSSNPYVGRDPRLDATVAKNGDIWPTSYKTALQTYYGGTNGEPVSGATPTGYYIKKYCHGAINLASNSKYKVDNHTWITFRLGEFYLNMAEALYKYFGSATATSAEFPLSATDYVNKVRARAKMPNFPTSLGNDAFWAKYKNERMVELAFEGHRFWDVRRWKEGGTYFRNIIEAKLTKSDSGVITFSCDTIKRQWDDKMYLFPIPQSERQKNKNLTQNPGW